VEKEGNAGTGGAVRRRVRCLDGSLGADLSDPLPEGAVKEGPPLELMCPDLEYQRMNAADLGNTGGGTELAVADRR
jgi:hypothetical protein